MVAAVTTRRCLILLLALSLVFLLGWLLTVSWGAALETSQGTKTDAAGPSPQQKAEELGIRFEKLKPGYLNRCARSGKLLFTSGHTSKIKGRLGAGLTTKQGYEAGRECAVEILKAVWNSHGTLNNLRVVEVLGCVNSSPDFIEQPQVINGCSDLLHEIFGKQSDGYHARSALGFAALPGGVAVEIEAIFEIKD